MYGASTASKSQKTRELVHRGPLRKRNDQPTLRSNLSLSAMIAINSLFVGFPLSF